MKQTKDVKLNADVQQRLAALAEARDRSPHWLMCKAIETYLEQEEKVEREKAEDKARWETYQLSGKAMTHETATQWLEKLAKGSFEKGKVEPCPK